MKKKKSKIDLGSDELLEQIVCPNCDSYTFTVFRDFDGVVEKLICSECNTILYV